MLLKICIFGCLALIACADNSIDFTDDTIIPTDTRVEHSVSFETSHKRPTDEFETAHKVGQVNPQRDAESDFPDLMQLQETMNLLPTKERPELNPILSALINEDVMKSIEAKRAIEQKELDIIKAEIEEAVHEEEAVLAAAAQQEEAQAQVQTEAPPVMLTTMSPVEKKLYDSDDEINVGFVDQTINLDAAGSESNKKSRIEIKKGPNGQDYEYEYVYYYEEDEDDEKTKNTAVATAAATEKETRGKSRYTNIERNNAVSPTDNTLVSGKAKGRSSSVSSAENVEVERLPVNTRFPSRGKNVDVPPTPALDSLENAAEKKKISVKRPSLELVDSDTFNTDEKQAKGSRNADTEASKPAHAIEQEQAAAAAADAANAAIADSELEAANNGEPVTEVPAEEGTTQSMQKAALDLYAILTNENFNMDMTTDADLGATTLMPKDDDMLTTLVQEEPSSSSTTSTSTTTTTTEAPTTTTTTTTTTTPASLFGGRRGGLAAAGRNRYKSKSSSATTTTTTETTAPAEPTVKAGRNRFARPSIGGRNRITPKTTTAPSASAEEQEVVEKKEVKPVSSAFGRGRPRNRFNIRGSTTSTEKPVNETGEDASQEETVSSTTARTLRVRPTLNLRGRTRPTTTKAPAENAPSVDGESAPAAEEKPVASAAVKPSRFNINRPGANRLLPRTKLGRTTEAPVAASADADSAVEGTHHNDVKEASEEAGAAEKTEAEVHVSHAAGGLNRLKSRPRLNTIQKTESAKPKPTPIAPRRVNPLLAKRRLQLGSTTTEAAPAEEEPVAAAPEEAESKDDSASVAQDTDASEEAVTEEIETTTKTQARGLGLLGQRRRLPLRKPGTIL